jgi:hypothetical protein
MKFCDWCGRENEDAALTCKECGTQQFKTPAVKTGAPEVSGTLPEGAPSNLPEIPPAGAPCKSEFRELTPQEKEMDLVTLIRCRTLSEADMVVSELDGAGISAFIPDEFLSQTMAWNLNAFGYVRVQVSPNDYESAKAFLLAEPAAPEPGTAPNN